MSSQFGKVLSSILLERFGVVVETVATHLYHHGSSPLLFIKKYTNLSISKIKESLAILIKYGLVSFQPNKNENIANYTLKAECVLLMLRYPKYINLIKKKFGDEAEMIVEEILQRGYWTASEVIFRVHDRVSKSSNISLHKVKELFTALVNSKYLKRVAYSRTNIKPVPELNIEEKELHIMPSFDLIPIKKVKSGEQAEIPDKNIYWTVNFNRFHQDMRDKIIVTAFTKKFDDNAGELANFLLNQMYMRTEPWADVSNPIPILEIKDLVKKQKNLSQLNAFFDQYVSLIEEDHSNLIRKFSEASGGSFQIYLKQAFKQFAWELAEQCITEKFDTKAARIFRLIKLKEFIEPENIQQQAMIPAKEAKRLTYQLLEENFIETQELRKATPGGPNKSFMLFHVKLSQVVHTILELSYKTLYNIMSRRNHEKDVNKRIIDKKQRVDTIAMGMRAQGASEEQLADIEEMITPPEREILHKIETTMKKINTLELEIDDTIFLLQMYLKYH